MSRATLPALLGLRIQGEKSVGHLLDPAHPKGDSKAKFLVRFGVSAAHRNILAEALVQHCVSATEARMMVDAVGSGRILREGSILAVDGREP